MHPQPNVPTAQVRRVRPRTTVGLAAAFALLALVGAYFSLSVRAGDAEALPNKKRASAALEKSKVNAAIQSTYPQINYFYAVGKARCSSVLGEDYVTFRWSTANTTNVSIKADSPYDGFVYNNLPTTGSQAFRVKCGESSAPFRLTARNSGPAAASMTIYVPIERI